VLDKRLAELASSVAEFGVLQPVLVGPEAAGAAGAPYYPLVAGNRRVVAARLAGLSTIPAIVRSAHAEEIRILQLAWTTRAEAPGPRSPSGR
jgi:ParB family transcriptional regulator, chromosome partitioning protein